MRASLPLLAAALLAFLRLAPLENPRARGRDFATYREAARAAARGLDPYDASTLSRLSVEEGGYRLVQPFLYPPAALLLFSWNLLVRSPVAAASAWALVEALSLALLLLALQAWARRSLGARAPPLALGLLAALYAPVAEDLRLGQVNLLVAALSAWGLYLASRRDREGWGGTLLGLAAAIKLAPAALAASWLLGRRWRPLLAMGAAFLGANLLALPLLGPEGLHHYLLGVLPGLGGGDWGLAVPIALQGNHSVPNLLDELFPGPSASTLSAAARWLSLAAALGLGLALVPATRGRGPELLRAGAWTAWMLLVPTYTYDHHLVWTLLPLTGCWAALRAGRLEREWRVPLALAGLALLLPTAAYQGLSARLGLAREPLYYLLREARFLALLLLLAACAWGSWRGARSRPVD